MNSIPWVEKYRPSELSKVVLNDENRSILNNIISMKHFPNLLFYGPPGTGKTTTMVNLISEYQKDILMRKSLCIHLNASDERGIDTIRYQISNFINSKGLFNSTGTKFIILDEVQNMTFEHIKGFMTRIGKYSKVVMCGDINQVSPMFQNSGLKEYLEMVEYFDMNVHTIEFTRDDVLRSGVCKEQIIAFEEWDALKHK